MTSSETIAKMEREWKGLLKATKSYLVTERGRHHRVQDTRGLTKMDLANDIMFARHGRKLVRAWAEAN